jgi:peptidoglycan-associated lipoprotein
MKRNRDLVLIGIATLTLVAAGCAKKAPIAKDIPQAPQPVITQPTPTRAETPTRAANTPTPVAEETPRSRFPDAATRKRIDELLARIEDAYFDYDKHTLRTDAIKTLETDSRELRDIIVQYPDYKLTIEGHADERGSAEYNMMLGQARAESAKKYLVGVGIPSDQLGMISYGKEKPACQEHDEACWQKNRRIHIVAMAK